MEGLVLLNRLTHRIPVLSFALLALAVPASALSRISVVSPSPSQPVFNVQPTISVTYSSDDPTAPLNLDSLTVLVNGVDWTGKFTKGAGSASYAVSAEDALVAGTLTIEASISDQKGGFATASQPYEVFPTLQALTPTAAHEGDEIRLEALALDPDAADNLAVFPSIFVRAPAGAEVPFLNVDRANNRGTVVVPEGALTGSVFVRVNGKASREKPSFTVLREFAWCASIQKMASMTDGNILVQHAAYGSFGATDDPTTPCPEIPYPPVRNWTGEGSVITLHKPDGSVELVQQAWTTLENNFLLVASIAVDKSGSDYALVTNQGARAGAPVLKVSYKGVTSELPGLQAYPGVGADFDGDGNLYVAAFGSGGRALIKLLAQDLAHGGPIGYVTLTSLNLGARDSLVDVSVSCEGRAYWGINNGVYPFTSRIQELELATGQTTGMPVPGGGTGAWLLNLALTANPRELLATNEPDVNQVDIQVLRSQDGGGLQAVDLLPGASVDSSLTVGPSGAVYLEHYDYRTRSGSIVRSRFKVTPNPQTGLAQPYCKPLEIKILPSTERWKPQRDTADNITVNFKGPSDLDPASVRLEVTPPGGPANYTPTIGEVSGTEDQYTFDWTGPWTYEVSDPVTDAVTMLPLPSGNYNLVVAGKRQDSETEIKSNPPYEKVSLVEVKTVKFLGLPENALEAEPGGNSRIFAEAKTPPGNLDPNPPALDMVAVEAEVDPPIEGVTVPVYFMALDVSDAKPEATPIQCKAQVGFDNCGTPKAGLFVQPNGSTSDGSVPVSSDANGATAAARFRVSTRQGDNYRFAASTSDDWLRGLYAVIPSPSAEVLHATESLQGNRQVSPTMLTVWRTLHLERDQMAGTQADQDALDAGPGREFTALTSNRLEDGTSPGPFVWPFYGLDHMAADDWTGGQLWVDFHAQDKYEVTANSANTVTVGVPPLPQPDLKGGLAEPFPSRAYRVRDDDLISLQQQLDLSLAGSIFAEAYIRLVEEPQPSPEDPVIPLVIEPFSALHNQYLNSTPGQSPLPAQLRTSNNYWSISVVGAFEGDRKADVDPTSEKWINSAGYETQSISLGVTTIGKVTGAVGAYKFRSAVFLEVIRDIYARPPLLNVSPDLNRRVTAHEMLHTMGLLHEGSSTQGGLMCAGINFFNTGGVGDSITADQRRALRAAEFPKGADTNQSFCQP